jgi:hypothetical protein
MKKALLGLLLLSFASWIVYGCAVGAATAGYAAKSSTADNLTSDGLKGVSETVKAQVISDMHKDGTIKSDYEIYQMVLDRLKREGYIREVSRPIEQP